MDLLLVVDVSQGHNILGTVYYCAFLFVDLEKYITISHYFHFTYIPDYDTIKSRGDTVKIYDKKLFWVSIVGLVAVLAYFVLLYSIRPDENNTILWLGAITLLINTARDISISISEEKSKEYRSKEQLSITAAENLFGKKGRYVPWLRFIPLIPSVLIASSKGGNMTLATVLLVLPVIFIVWYLAVIEKEIKRIKEHIEE